MSGSKRVMISVLGDVDGVVTQFLADLDKKGLFPRTVMLLRVDPSPVVTLVEEIPLKKVSLMSTLCTEVTWPVIEKKKA